MAGLVRDRPIRGPAEMRVGDEAGPERVRGVGGGVDAGTGERDGLIALGSDEAEVEKRYPLPKSALPESSTATQKVLEGHETEERPFPFGSTETGVDQLVPFQVSALAEEPTAPQKVLEGHETARSNAFGSTETGVDQAVPFQVSALPE